MDFLLTPAEVWLQWKTYLLNDELPQYVDYIKFDANERRVNNKQLYLPEVEKTNTKIIKTELLLRGYQRANRSSVLAAYDKFMNNW